MLLSIILLKHIHTHLCNLSSFMLPSKIWILAYNRNYALLKAKNSNYNTFLHFFHQHSILLMLESSYWSKVRYDIMFFMLEVNCKYILSFQKLWIKVKFLPQFLCVSLCDVPAGGCTLSYACEKSKETSVHCLPKLIFIIFSQGLCPALPAIDKFHQVFLPSLPSNLLLLSPKF